MIIIIKRTLSEFSHKHSTAAIPLNRWHEIAKLADWASLNDIKKDFSSVDYVGNDRYVFNIKGNDYRLVTMIFFDVRTIFIRFVGTHKDYDNIKDIKNI